MIHALNVTRVDTIDDPCLGDYRDIAAERLRDRSRGFALESREVVRRCLRERRFRVRSLLLTEPALETLRELLDPTIAVYVAGHDVIRHVVGFNFHRGCMGIGERGTPLALADVLTDRVRTVVVCERLSNLDNVGGVFRNAMAFGAGAVLLSPGSADPLHRKVVRVSIGASVSVPFVQLGTWPDPLATLRASGLTVVALTPRGGVDVAAVAPPARMALLVGAEGDGLTDAALASADVRVSIPMADGVDSLNAAVATGIALHRLAPGR